MRKVGVLMLMMGLSIISFYIIYVKTLNTREEKAVEKYISETTETNELENIEESANNENITNNKIIGKEIKYTAILEIPSINLKRGVVDNTKNFNSINYAISVDGHSSYPDNYGNFILYAHSGTSSIAFFKNLTKVNINYDVYVYYNGTKYQYRIINKYDIEKTGKAKVITSNDDYYITLITCNQSKKGYQSVLVGKLTNKIIY